MTTSSIFSTADRLATLNNYRAAEGKTPFADWRNARHMPMLEAYIAAEAAAKAAKTEAGKLPSYKEFARYEKSLKEKPLAFIHAFLSENPTLTRKQAVHALVSDHGINYSTARTQYQRWFVANKRGN